MGLDFVGSDARWAYSGFMRFRCKLAKGIGIDLNTMEGFVGEITANPFKKPMSGVWKDVKDPLKWLLNHSDCEGQISARRCGLIAPRIRDVVKDWDVEDLARDRWNAILLAEGMEQCAEDGKPLIFS